jgi:hypothetical protein
MLSCKFWLGLCRCQMWFKRRLELQFRSLRSQNRLKAVRLNEIEHHVPIHKPEKVNSKFDQSGASVHIQIPERFDRKVDHTSCNRRCESMFHI